MAVHSNSVGADGISLKMLSQRRLTILPNLTHIFNFGIQTAVFPFDWKRDHIIPEQGTDMESIALARLQTRNEVYEIFVECRDKFGAIFCIPFNVLKFDPIIIKPENLSECCSNEDANTIEITLRRIGKITL